MLEIQFTDILGNGDVHNSLGDVDVQNTSGDGDVKDEHYNDRNYCDGKNLFNWNHSPQHPK